MFSLPDSCKLRLLQVGAVDSEDGTDVKGRSKAGAYASALFIMVCLVSIYASKIGMNSTPA